jgi:tungstate transport system ATP-binding protein
MKPLPALRLEGVSFAAGGKTLIDGVTLELASGPRTIILGPNGAGKSLLLRICHGLLPPSAGTTMTRGRQAMVFQRPVMLRRSVRANVHYALAVNSVARAERRPRADRALERFGLVPLADRPARVLSGGEQQRLALARAWALEPTILFLDEPTANLDPASTRAVEEAIGAFHEGGVKIVMTTHDMGQARRLADEVVFVHRGRVLEHQPAAGFFRAPATVEARAYLAGDLLW